jgi:hypothetical protein
MENKTNLMELDYLKSITVDNLTTKELKELLLKYNKSEIARILKLNSRINKYSYIEAYVSYNTRIYFNAIKRNNVSKDNTVQVLDIPNIIVDKCNITEIVQLLSKSNYVSNNDVVENAEFRTKPMKAFCDTEDKYLHYLHNTLEYIDEELTLIDKLLSIDKCENKIEHEIDSHLSISNE